MSFLLLEKYVLILLSNNYIEPYIQNLRKKGLKEGPAILGLAVNLNGSGNRKKKIA